MPLISDPFGRGWNLLGTAGYRPDIALVGARFAWYTAVGAALLGHIVAVYLAHLRAMQVFDARAAVLRSQLPLTALMVVYTFVSLSILAYPLGVGSYDAYAIPRRAFITEVVEKNGRFRISADIEVVRKFQRSYTIDRQPLPTIQPVERVRAAPECRYTVLDEQGRVVTAGVVRPGDDAAFDVNLATKLSPGRYTMLAMITVNENAMNAEIRRIPVFVSDR